MKRFAISTVLAGGLFAGLFGAAGAAHAATTPPAPTAASSNAPQIFDAGGYDAPSPVPTRIYEAPSRVYDADSYYGPQAGCL